MPGYRAKVAAQARSDHRAGPARGTIPFVSCRARAELFRVVPVPAHLAIYKRDNTHQSSNLVARTFS
jgi:hypothetical protein